MRNGLALACALAIAACKKPPPPDPFAVPAQAGEVRLVTSSATAAPSDGLRVYVARDALSIGTPPKKVAALPPPSKRDDLYVKELGDAVTAPADHALVFVDREAPYRLVGEVLYTLGRRDVAHYELAVKDARGKTTAIPIFTPSCVVMATLGSIGAGGGLAGLLGSSSASRSAAPPPPAAPKPPTRAIPPCPMDVPRLAPALFVISDGLSIKARGGNVAPGCNDVGAGLTLPRVSGAYDLAGLTACLAKLKALDPAFASEKEITVSASPDIAVESVIAAIDAARSTPDGKELFPSVVLGVTR